MLDRQGWFSDRFLLSDRLLGATDERVNLSPDCARIASGIRRYKSLDRWTSLSDTLFAEGQEARGFVLLCAFAGPLLGLLQQGGVGVCLNTKDPAQASMLFAAVQSVYARQSTFRISRTLPHDRKGQMLRACGHLPCIYPEVFRLDPAASDVFVEQAVAQDSILLASHDKFLNPDMARQEGDTYDVTRRYVMEIPLPDSDHARDAELTATYHNNFGYAGDAYVRYLAANTSYFRQAVQSYALAVRQKLGDRQDERLLLNLIACVGMAARITEKLGLLHVTSERMVQTGARLLDIMRAQDYQAAHLPETLLEDYLMDKLDAILVMRGGAKASKRDEVQYDGVAPTEIRYETLTRKLFVSRERFHDWCKGRYQSGHATVLALLKHGVARKRETIRSLRSSHPHMELRPNPRIGCFEVDPDHPLINSAVRRLERELKVNPVRVVRGADQFQDLPESLRTVAAKPSAPPESD